MKTLIACLAILAVAGCSMAQESQGGNQPMAAKSAPQSRLGQLVEANIIAVHAYQIGLAQKAGKGDPQCYSPGALSAADLDAIVAHQAALVKDDAVQILAWTKNAPSTFDPGKDLSPILATKLALSPKLPVNVFTDYLAGASKADRVSVRAVANLYQCCLEMERDGTLLWDLMDFYIAFGLPTYVGQFGLPGSDADFLAVGEKLAPLTCDSPFEDNATTPFAWEIAGRKIWNWGEKFLHIRDQYTMAREILAEPDIRVLIPRMKAMPPQKIAVIGHSFTMQSHWSTPGSFAAVAGAALVMTNPQIEYKQWGGGGLTASRAFANFYKDALAWKPNKVLFAVAMRKDQDLADLKTMCKGFADAGAAVYTFDNLRDPSEDAVRNEMGPQVAADTGLVIIQVGKLLHDAPDKGKFVCLDKIHMTEPYHRLMAREWFKFLVGARGANL